MPGPGESLFCRVQETVMRRALFIVAVNFAVLVSLLLLFEIFGQTLALLRPSYEVLFLQPDRTLGWKQVPNLHWKWTGLHWYAADFSVDVKTNASGFRDLDRQPEKPKGVNRVALIGDSLIEAVQVPGQLLEQKLNVGEHRQRWEVLNFGISNYGIGQYLLVWENYAARYQPHYVFVIVARFNLDRTLAVVETTGALKASSMKQLRVRPTFRLDQDNLVRQEAPDYDEFVHVQAQAINSEFGGGRSRRRVEFILPHYVDFLRNAVCSSLAAPLEEYSLRLNLKILETLGKDVARKGARMVVLNTAPYFEYGNLDLSAQLEEFCNLNNFGYVPLYKILLEANTNGKPTYWRYDCHFNELGNELLAGAMYDWLAAGAR
jgi:hypothetical protein